METWQNTSITTNLFTLTKLIKCDSLFLADLREHNILSVEDTAEVESKPHRYNKAQRLLEIIQTKTKGYEALLRALSRTQQTGAVEVMLRSISPSILEEFKVVISNRTFYINSVLSSEQVSQLWSDIQEMYESSELVIFFFNKYHKSKEIKFVNNTIPPSLPYYMPMALLKRFHIKPEVFKAAKHDIFVIEGIERYQLSELSSSEITAYSYDQLDGITARFIKLVHRKDWEQLRAISKYPIHLIVYEEGGKGFVLEETTDSRIIRHFVQIQHEDDISLSEDQILNAAEKDSCVCICDLPGMGKTQVLANLARKASKDPNKFVIFIHLHQFVKSVRTSLNWKVVPNPQLLICQYLTRTSIGSYVLQKIVQELNLKFDIFFDGFDEISNDDLPSTKMFLKELTKGNFAKIYLTSRPHRQHELEDTLRVLPYTISKLNFNDQTNFLINSWRNKGLELQPYRLLCFAQLCLRKFKNTFGNDNTGIPSHCRLIAEAYEKQALRYCEFDSIIPDDKFVTFGKHLGIIYTKCIESKFSVEIPDSSNRDAIRQKLQQLAIKEVIPELNKNKPLEKSSSKVNYEQILSIGLLEEIHNGECVQLRFINKTVAEYLVAESTIKMLLSNVLLRNNTKKSILAKSLEFVTTGILSNSNELCSSLLRTILKTEGTVKSVYNFRVDPYRFAYSTVMFFFDHLLEPLTPIVYTQIVKTLVSTPGRDDMYRIITSCGLQNLVNLLQFVECICKSTSLRYYVLASNQRVCIMCLTICIPSKPETLSKCMDFFRNFYSFTADDMLKICEERNWQTPLQVACRNKLFDCLEYF